LGQEGSFTSLRADRRPPLGSCQRLLRRHRVRHRRRRAGPAGAVGSGGARRRPDDAPDGARGGTGGHPAGRTARACRLEPPGTIVSMRATPGPQPPREGLTEAAAWRVVTRGVLLVFSLLFGVWLAVQLRSVVVQVLLAIILSAGMAPLVERCSAAEPGGPWRWRPPRALVVLALYLALITLIIVIGLLVVPPLAAEIEDLAGRLPTYVADFQAWLRALPSRYPFLPVDLNEALGA